MTTGSQQGSIAGGIVGGIIGGMVGMPALGFAIGSMAGGMIGGALDPPDDQVTDLGANAFPDFNTAMRGLTVPVIFGTNRVSSQIAWQGNSQIIKNTTNTGGGKSGGSGAPSAKQVNTTYDYKLDLIYHLGLVYQPSVLYNAWETSGKKISGTSISQITTTGETDEDYTSTGLDTTTDRVTLAFTSGVFFAGNHPEPEDWSILTSAVGSAVRWPGTAWVGLQGLNLGSTISIPQLSWEIGSPQDASITNDPNFTGGGDLTDQQYLASRNPVDQHGNVWVRQYNGTEIAVYSNGGTLLQTYDLSGTALAPLNPAGADLLNVILVQYPLWNLVDPVSTNFEYWGGAQMKLLHDGNQDRIIVTYITMAYPATISQAPSRVIASGRPNADGTITWLGACLQDRDRDDSLYMMGFHMPYTLFDLGGFKTFNDPIVVGGTAGISGIDWGMVVLPAINKIEGIYSGSWVNGNFHKFITDNAYLALPATSTYIGNVSILNYENMFTLPDFSGDCRIFGYLNRTFNADLIGFTTDFMTNDWRTSPLSTVGGLFEVTGMSVAANEPGLGAVTLPIDNDLPNPTILYDKFIDAGGTYSSLPGDGYDYDTGSTQTNVTATWLGTPYMAVQASGGVLCIWGQPYSRDPVYATDPALNLAPRIKLRAYMWSPLAGTFTELANAKGFNAIQTDVGYNTDVSGYSDPQIDYIDFGIKVSEEGGLTVYSIAGPYGGSNFTTSYVWWGQFGDIILGGGGQLTPPEIIRAILVNSYFGMFPGEAIIDSTSYNEAVTYCETYSIKVGSVYKNDESAQRHIELLLACYSGYLVIDASTNTIKFGLQDDNTTPVRTIDNTRLLRNEGQLPVKTTKGAAQDTYNMVRVAYLDRALDYKQNQIEVGDEVDQDLSGIRLRDFPPQFVMTAETAYRMANRALWDNLYTRDMHSFRLGWKDCDLEPGDLITLVDSFSGLNQVVRINRMKEVERGVFDVGAKQQLFYIPGQIPSSLSSSYWNNLIFADTYDSYPSQSEVSSISTYRAVPVPMAATAYEVPAEVEITPHVYITWISDGPAAGATLYLSPDGGSYAIADNATPYPTAGRIMRGLPNNADPVTNLDVIIQPSSSWSVGSPAFSINATLPEITPAAMQQGLATILVGSEMLAYNTVTLLSQNTYRLGNVYRGWAGSPIASHSSLDLFFHHGNGVFSQEYGIDRIGTTFYYKVVPYGFYGDAYDVSSVVAQQYTILGSNYRPQSPATPQYLSGRGITKVNAGSAVDIPITWPATSRTSGFGFGGAGSNAGGAGSFTDDAGTYWAVSVVGSGSLVVRSTTVTTPNFTYTSSQNAADNGAWRGNVAFNVTPRNAYGNAPATAVISMELFF